MVVRTYEDELQYIEKINDFSWRIKKGFQVSGDCVKIKIAGMTKKCITLLAKYEC